MYTTKRAKKISLFALCLVMATSLMIGTVKLVTDGINANALTAKNALSIDTLLTYDKDEFEVVEDYAPFVPAVIKGVTVDPNRKQLMRLDNGKTGLLVRSKLTGEDVVGKGFSFTNAMRGEFSMDFRVFSEYSAEFVAAQTTVNGGCNAFWNTNTKILSSLDIRRIGLTFTSVSNPDKAFTLYVYTGEQGGHTYDCTARVYIKGETWRPSSAKDMLGYGLNNNAANNYGYATNFSSNSFCNTSAYSGAYETQSTTIKFDPATMNVYGVNKTMEFAYDGSIKVGAIWSENDVLIRNLSENRNANGASVSAAGMGTLSSADFEKGYTTSVVVDSMTPDYEPLTIAKSVGSGETAEEPTTNNVFTDTGVENYKRYAKMVIYSVNGQKLVRNDDWTVETNYDSSIVEFNKESGLKHVSYTNATASYVTDTHVDGEAGSTKFVTNGKILTVNTVAPFIRHHGDKVVFDLNVYVSGGANDYVLEMTNKNNAAYTQTVDLTKDAWNKINIRTNNFYTVGGENWEFDLNDYNFNVYTKGDDAKTTESGVNVYFGRFYYHQTKTTTDDTVDNGYLYDSQIRLISSASNIAAEGNAYGIKSSDYKMSDGTYILGVTGQSANYAAKGGNESSDLGDFYSQYGSKISTGANTYQKDPYSDVREIGIRFRSTVNESKSFTVYVAASSHWRARTTVRVGVDGEAYINGSGNKGFATTTNTDYYNLQKGGVSGSMGQWGNTGGSYNNMNELASYIKFEPSTMKVYAQAYGWGMIRDLTSKKVSTASSAAEVKGLETLDKSDFADGKFTIEIFVSQMNTEWNKGLSEVWSLNSGKSTSTSINYATLTESYDRKCIIDVYSGRLNRGLSVNDDTAYSIQESGYGKGESYVDMSGIEGGYFTDGKTSFTLKAPKVINLFETITYEGEVAYASKDGTDTGVVTFANGEATFTPAKTGEYTFTLNGESKTVEFKKYQVIYNDGTGDQVKELDDKVFALSELGTPVKEGYMFIGWTISGLDGVYSGNKEIDVTVNGNVSAFFIKMEMIQGASIRLSQTTPGIRFGAKISAGELLALRDILGDSKIKFEYTLTANGVSVTKQADLDENLIYDDDEDVYYLYASVIGLKKTQYETQFTAAVKATITTTDGEQVVKTVTSDNGYSVKEVANIMLESGKEFNNVQLSILKEFAGIE